MSLSRTVPTVLFAALVTLVSTGAPDVSARAVATGKVAPIFEPLLPQLRGAHIHVYLPAWLPHYGRRIYATGGLDKHGYAYFVSLSTSPHGGDAALVFWMTAQPGPGNDSGRTVTLGHGVTGFLDRHVGGNEGPTVFWRRGHTGYMVGGLTTQETLLRVVRSVVRVR